MKSVAQRAFDNRIELSTLCQQAGLSRTIAYRWLNRGSAPLLGTIKKLETALANMENAHGNS